MLELFGIRDTFTAESFVWALGSAGITLVVLFAILIAFDIFWAFIISLAVAIFVGYKVFKYKQKELRHVTR